MTNLSGQYLGRYHLLERLGEGGMAVVYKAYDTRLEREVAIKIIRCEAFPPETLQEVLRRFEREAKALARLSHANIVKVYDFGEHEGSPYLVMEYLPGGTLKKMLGTPIAWQEAIHLLLPIARGIAYAHQHGILHRDIKPANILITADNQPMLTDFGIAKVFEGDQPPALTLSGMFVGTPDYMAPEQWTGKTSPQSDIYSLGIVLYEMITGRRPYVADTPAAILLKQTAEPLPPPGKFVSGLPEPLEMILIKALAKEPEDRYRDMNAMVSALEGLFPPIPLEPFMPKPAAPAAAPTGAKMPSRSKPKSSRKYWLAAAILVAGLVGVLCVVLGGASLLADMLWDTDRPGVVGTLPALSQTAGGTQTVLPAGETLTDACAGATEAGARQKFTLEQITPCLDSVPRVSAFMANNMQRDDNWDAENCGELCYSPAWLVYQNGVDDLHGLVTLECYFLEQNGWDAEHVGIAIETPTGTNVCSVNTAEGLVLLDSDGMMVGTFDTLADVARYYISQGKMKNGDKLRTIKASQITQSTTLSSTPSLMGLPWVFHDY